MDRPARGPKHREHRRRALAHVRPHPFPRPRGFPRHARGAHVGATAAKEFLPEEPRPGCAPELLLHAEPGRWEAGWVERGG